MRFLATIILAGAQLAAAGTTIATCNRDNCLRAIIATTRSGSADCSSFLKTTVTPSPMYAKSLPGHGQAILIQPLSVIISSTTSTTTLTETVLTDNGFPLRPRQTTVVPTSIPAYASACSGAVRYSSACSCIAITGDTTTAPTPTSTYTITFTQTECANAFPTFALQVENSNITQMNGEKLDGSYANIDNGDGDLIGFNGYPPYGAALFSLNAAGNIVMDANGLIGYTDPGQNKELLHFTDVADAYASENPAVCNVANDVLSCTTGAGQDILQLCPGKAVTDDVFIGKSVPSGCVAPRFQPLFVCTPQGVTLRK